MTLFTLGMLSATKLYRESRNACGIENEFLSDADSLKISKQED